MGKHQSELQKKRLIDDLDEKFSSRFIQLDPKGYFLIKVDQLNSTILVEHFSNNIDEIGRAINPETGEPIECSSTEKRSPTKVFRGKTAKQLGIQITEQPENIKYISKLDHALYLGRELQKAEQCLINGTPYLQD